MMGEDPFDAPLMSSDVDQTSSPFSKGENVPPTKSMMGGPPKALDNPEKKVAVPTSQKTSIEEEKKEDAGNEKYDQYSKAYVHEQ